MLKDFERKSIEKMKELGFNEQFVKEMEENEGYGDMPSIKQIESWVKELNNDVSKYENCNKFYYWATYI